MNIFTNHTRLSKAILYCLLLAGSSAVAQQKVGDNLGTHKATKDLQMNGFQLLDAKGIAIGTATFSSNSVALEIAGSNKALVVSRLATSTDMNALNAVDGMIVYVTADAKFYLRQNGTWAPISTGSASISAASPNAASTPNGFTISPLGVIALSPADASNPGIITNGVQTLAGDKTLTGITSISNTTASTSPSVGALVVTGGTGIGGAANIAGITTISNNTPSTTTTSGALVVTGGTGIGGAANIGGVTTISNSTASTSSSTGALVVAGGMGLTGAANIAGATNISNNTASTSATTGALVVTGGTGIGGAVNIGGSTSVAGITTLSNNTSSTSTTTGAMVVTGGAGIGENVNIGKALKGNSTSAANASSSTLSNFSAEFVTSTTSRTLTLADNGKVILMNSASAVTVTIPTTLHAGFNCLIVQQGAGQVTIAGASGVTVSNRSGFTKTAGVNAILSIIGLSGTSFICSGDMSN